MTLSDCKIIELPKEEDPRGSLTYIYENVQVPFPIKRVFYIYDVPAGKDRGAHAHKECWQFIIAASGALEVYLSDGKEEKTAKGDSGPMEQFIAVHYEQITEHNGQQGTEYGTLYDSHKV